MKNLSLPVFIGILFSAIGTATIFISGEVLTAAIWLSFGNGLVLSSLRFKRPDMQGQVVSQPVPRVRMAAGVFLIVVAVLLLVLQIYQDLEA